MAKRSSRHGNKNIPTTIQKQPQKFNNNKPYQAFTQKNSITVRQIITDVFLTPPFDPKDHSGSIPFTPLKKKALWDTGATNSVIKGSIALELGLKPVTVTEVSHAGGVEPRNTYLINIILPNKVLVYGNLVTEGPETLNGFDVIIGMDIINRGDFAITNMDGKTCVSFRLPSYQMIDFVEYFNKHKGRFSINNPHN